MDHLEIYMSPGYEHLLPGRAHSGDAGLDLHTTEDVVLQPGERAVVGTGVHVNIHYGYVGEVCPRSGLAAKKGVTVLNAPGIVDHGYIGEVKVVLINHSSDVVHIEFWDRIAQLLIKKVELPRVVRRSEPLGATERGDGGFGSTGD